MLEINCTNLFWLNRRRWERRRCLAHRIRIPQWKWIRRSRRSRARRRLGHVPPNRHLSAQLFHRSIFQHSLDMLLAHGQIAYQPLSIRTMSMTSSNVTVRVHLQHLVHNHPSHGPSPIRERNDQIQFSSTAYFSPLLLRVVTIHRKHFIFLLSKLHLLANVNSTFRRRTFGHGVDTNFWLWSVGCCFISRSICCC